MFVTSSLPCGCQLWFHECARRDIPAQRADQRQRLIHGIGMPPERILGIGVFSDPRFSIGGKSTTPDSHLLGGVDLWGTSSITRPHSTHPAHARSSLVYEPPFAAATAFEIAGAVNTVDICPAPEGGPGE